MLNWKRTAEPKPANHAARLSGNQRGYTVRWQRERAAFLNEFPLCGDRPHGLLPRLSRCRDLGIWTPATVVDHVRPHHGDDELFWDRNNWQSLCHSCHNAKTRAGF